MKNFDKVIHTLSLASSDTRQDTIESIIISSLYEFQKSVSYKELKENINLNYEIDLYEVELKESLTRLSKNGSITDEESNIYLSSDVNDKIHKEDREQLIKDEKVFKNFREFLIGELGLNNIKDVEILRLWSIYKKYLYLSFYNYGINAYKAFSGNPTGDNSNVIFEEAIKEVGDSKLIKVLKVIIDKYSDYASEEAINFVDEIGQKMISFSSLGLSENDISLSFDKELIDWILYLDTNFLYSILDLHINKETEASKELLKLFLVNKSHIKLAFRFTELTAIELRHKKNDFSTLDDSLTDSAIRALLKSEELDNFSRKYFSSLLENRESTIHPSEVVDLAEYTLPKKGIEISRTKRIVESIGEEYLETRIQEYHQFIERQNEIRREFAKNNNSLPREVFKSNSQIEHDITLRQIILRYRTQIKKKKIETFNDAKYFGVTLDSQLIKYDGEQVQKNSDIKHPVFFKPSFLLNKLVKILPVKTENYKTAFIKAVSSRGFNKDSGKSNDIIRFAAYFRKEGIDSEDILLNLVNDKLFLERFKKESQKEGFNSSEFIENKVNEMYEEVSGKLKESENKKESLSDENTKNLEIGMKLSYDLNSTKEELKLLQKSLKAIKKEKRKTVNVVQTTIGFDDTNNGLVKSNLEKDKIIEQYQQEETEREVEEEFKILRKSFILGFALYSIFYLIILAVIIYSFNGFKMIEAFNSISNIYDSNLSYRIVFYLLTGVYSFYFIRKYVFLYLNPNSIDKIKESIRKDIEKKKSAKS